MISAEERHRMQSQAAEIAAEPRISKGTGIGCKNGARVYIQHHFIVESGPYVMALARELWSVHGCRWFSYCLLRYHPDAFKSLDESQVEAFGQGIDNQDIVDSYARILSGPAWLHSLVSDDLIHSWTRSDDRWWRRAALVSTIALNVRSSDGGTGDTPRTLAVCRLLVGDRNEMVSKALSWALHALVAHDPQAVRNFVTEHEDQLAAQVRREVMKELERG